jgi:hypothetical protein
MAIINLPPPTLIDGERGDGKIVTTHKELESPDRIEFEALNVRPSSTGVHSYVEMFLCSEASHEYLSCKSNRVSLGYDTFNIERHAERGRLSNAAHKLLGDEPPKTADGTTYTQMLLKYDFDNFCRLVWDVWIGQYQPTELAGDPLGDPPQFLIHPLVIEQGGTILVGQRGSGKSYIAMAMCVATDSNTNHYWKVSQKKSLFVNLERSASSIQRRIGAVNGALGLPPDRPLLTLNARGKGLADVRSGIRQAIEKLGVEFVVLDSISRAGMGNLNDNEVGNSITDALNGFGTSWLAIAHPPRNSDNVFGSTMFENAADIVVRQTLVQRDNERGIQLSMAKANDTELARPSYYGLTFDEYGLQSMRVAKAEDYPELKATEQRSVTEQITDHLLHEAGEDTATNIAAKLGIARSTVTTVFSDTSKFNKIKRGKEVFYSVKTT